jgi:Fe-S oxidoreductase
VGGGWLLVELGGSSADEVASVAARLVGAASALDALIVPDRVRAAQLWQIREDGAGLSSRPSGDLVRHAGWEDAAVPVDRLAPYLRDFDALLVEHGLTGLPYGHFGDGCVHVRLDFPFGRAGGQASFRSFLSDAAHLVSRYGGSMSGEHGDGRARSELLPIMYSPEALRAFAEVKHVLDPDGVLNPGIVVDPRPPDADLRLSGVRPWKDVAFGYADDHGDFARAVSRCVGVGKCRADLTPRGGVMCPSFVATRDEKDSTRGRARVLQEMINGSLVQGWEAPEVHEVLDLCLACKGCSADCPTGVDMATYKAEVLHQTYRGRLRPMSHYTLGWLPAWARQAGRWPGLANWILQSPLSAVGKRVGGVDARRSLPRLSTPTFRNWFAGRPIAAGDPVMLFVDTFTDLFTPSVGQAAVQVLEQAGFAVQVPARATCCGLTWISTGQLDRARRELRRTMAALAPAVRANVPVVGLEPSCVAALRSDAGELLHDIPAAGRIGASVRTLAELLSDRCQWTPPDLRGLTILAKPHCHHYAVMGWGPDQTVLTRAGAAVTTVGGCCGLAGNFGVERGHYDVSVAIAEHALLPAVRAAPDAVIHTDGFSCRMQVEQLVGRRGRHLAEILTSGPAGHRG